MAPLSLIFFLIMTLMRLYGEDREGHLLYLLSRGEVKEAISAYKTLAQTSEKHADHIIEQMGLTLLYQAMQSKELEAQLYALVGASLSMSQKAERIYELAYESPFIEIQAASLGAIAQTHSDHCRFLIEKGIGHSHPLIRLLSAQIMAKLHLPGASSRIESLMDKFEPEIHFFFPEFFAEIDDLPSQRQLRKLLNHPKVETRLCTLQAIGEFRLESLMKDVRARLLNPDFREQENALLALAVLQDEGGRASYERLCESRYPQVRLLAHFALVSIGDKSKRQYILDAISSQNPFAILLAEKCEGAIPLLSDLAKRAPLSIKVNLLLPLIRAKDKEALPLAREIMKIDLQKQLLKPISSIGGSQIAYKVVDYASVKEEEEALLTELSLAYKETMIQAFSTWPEEVFFSFVKELLLRQENALTPLILALIKNIGSENAVLLLQELEQKAGSPYLRASASLALLSKNNERGSLDRVKTWLLSDEALQSIDLKVSLAPDLSSKNLFGQLTPFEVTPKERARLFIDGLIALVQESPSEAIDLILELLLRAPPKIRPLLAGFLLKAAE